MKKNLFFLATFLCAVRAEAQTVLTAPQPSLPAAVEQTVGITQMSVSYHRPSVAGRKIWGALVPYGQVWRAGANENTVFTTSSALTIGGKTLAAGSYGVHMIPSEKQWTVIFNTASKSWGSYSYDAKEDALRVDVTPEASEAFEERLSYRFDDPTDHTVTLALRWEKIKVPVAISVNTPEAVMANMRSELRGVAQFNPQAWGEAARYWLDHGGSLDEAAQMADRSIAGKETYGNLTTRAKIAEKKGDTKLAESLNKKAALLATETDINLLGYQLLAQHKIDEAIATFTKNAKAHPSSWNSHDSLAEAYVAKGDKKSAIASYKKALALVKDDANKKRIEETISRLEHS